MLVTECCRALLSRFGCTQTDRCRYYRLLLLSLLLLLLLCSLPGCTYEPTLSLANGRSSRRRALTTRGLFTCTWRTRRFTPRSAFRLKVTLDSISCFLP